MHVSLCFPWRVDDICAPWQRQLALLEPSGGLVKAGRIIFCNAMCDFIWKKKRSKRDRRWRFKSGLDAIWCNYLNNHMTFSCKNIGSPAIIHRWQTSTKDTRVNQTEPRPSSDEPSLLSSGVADEPNLENITGVPLQSWGGVGGGLGSSFFFLFAGLFLFPPAVGGCHWSMRCKTERETWRVTLKLLSVPDGLSLLPSTVRPREDCGELTSPLTLHTLERPHGHVGCATPTIWNLFVLSCRLWTEGCSKN